VREEERLQDGIHTYPEKSSVCGLFLAFFKLPTRHKTFLVPIPHHIPKPPPTTKTREEETHNQKQNKKNSHKTPKHSSTTEPPPFPSSSHLLPPNYKTQNLILMLPNNN
jgi:hypothetical protein